MIRKFSGNVSGLVKLAARDFEDLLQVCLDLQVDCYSNIFEVLVCDSHFRVSSTRAIQHNNFGSAV
jgi:hypothetical protein